MVIRFNDCTIDRKNLAITSGGRVFQFARTNRAVYSRHPNILFEAVAHLLLNGWTQKPALYHHLFGDDPNGGPEAGVDILSIRFNQARPTLEKLGLKIVRERRGGVTWFKVATENAGV